MPTPNTNRYRDCGDGSVAIETIKGAVFVIDASDREIASRHCWSRHEHGYARAVTRLPGGSSGRLKTVYLHRFLCETTVELPHVDHIDGDPANCRRSNLRACTRHQNLRNQKRRADNTSGFKNVRFHNQSGRWRATVRAGGAILDKGLFATPEEAAVVAEQRRLVLHREFARHG